MMSYLGLYFIKTTTVTGIFYAIYHLTLRKESFYSINRFYLLVSLIFAYLFPFLKVESQQPIPLITTLQATANQFIYTEELATNDTAVSSVSSPGNYWYLWLAIGVSALFLIRFLKHLFHIRKTIFAHERITHPKFTLVFFKHQNAFSFFRYIFISQSVWNSPKGNYIVDHEMSHIRHKHSLDRLFVEMALIVFWMNPFIYLYRKALEEVHELQADKDVTKRSQSVRNYFKLVLEHSAQRSYSPLMSPFSYQLIKKRIAMSNHKSNPIKKAFLLIPISTALFILTLSSTGKLPQETIAESIMSAKWPTNQEEASLFFEIPSEAIMDNGAVKAGNVFSILINAKGRLLMEGKAATLAAVKPAVKGFLSNDGPYPERVTKNIKGIGKCQVNSGLISLRRDIYTSQTDADTLINEITKAYHEVRDEASQKHFGKPLSECQTEERQVIKELIPYRLSFDTPKNIGMKENVKINPIFTTPIKEGEQYEITSGFGMRWHPVLKEKKKHNGIDYKAKMNTPVVAIADGTVRKVHLYHEAGKGYGKFIIIDHANRFSSLYAQLNAYKVNEGDKVNKGDVIALVGSSGLSTGPHLHLELKKDGKHVDPANYIRK
jgi:murein DD-endopeptidase MepM/ murein hydrolase activator NlpD